jgi:hypothetical protein
MWPALILLPTGAAGLSIIAPATGFVAPTKDDMVRNLNLILARPTVAAQKAGLAGAAKVRRSVQAIDLE